MTAFLFEGTNGNLLLGYMPEPLGLLVFGIFLIILAVGLRWVFKKNENSESEKGIEKKV